MPFYVFKNPKTGEVREVLLPIEGERSYQDEKGLKWERVFTVPYVSTDTSLDPFSEKDFAQKTANKKYNVGDMWDLSKELGEKRKKQEGRDSVGEKHAKDKEKKRPKNKKP